ncbi:hypothetical protein GOP47_0010224 [Adiantum capillus-veneris]|uniref:Uncharacterized protein n=1 Tax=Adiantum capillus-veneris TaxID=13818 RepID=A0A9D4UUC4_ADICA|nr:hypothetical protein GOP47_0010224 [Adiantum capillus-veneris]
MIRQILGRLPRTKPTKPDNNEATGGQPPASAGGLINSIKALSAQAASSAHAGAFGKAGPETSTLSSAPPSRIANGARTVPFPVGDNPFSFSQEPLPLFRDVPNSEKQNLFIRKLNLCTVVFDFTDASKNVKEKEIKKQTLHELADYVSAANAAFSEIVIEEATKMVAANIFRSLPPSLHDNPGMESLDFDEEEPAMEPAWSHLQIVYEFFLRFVMSSETDAKVSWKKFWRQHSPQNFSVAWFPCFDRLDVA